MNFIAPKLSVEIVVVRALVSLHRTDRRKLVTIFIIQLYTVPPSRKVNLSTCSEC